MQKSIPAFMLIQTSSQPRPRCCPGEWGTLLPAWCLGLSLITARCNMQLSPPIFVWVYNLSQPGEEKYGSWQSGHSCPWLRTQKHYKINTRLESKNDKYSIFFFFDKQLCSISCINLFQPFINFTFRQSEVNLPHIKLINHFQSDNV